MMVSKQDRGHGDRGRGWGVHGAWAQFQFGMLRNVGRWRAVTGVQQRECSYDVRVRARENG